MQQRNCGVRSGTCHNEQPHARFLHTFGTWTAPGLVPYHHTMLPHADAWSTQTSEVPFLRRFVYTAKAPTALLDAWAPLGNGTAPGGGMLAEVRCCDCVAY